MSAPSAPRISGRATKPSTSSRVKPAWKIVFSSRSRPAGRLLTRKTDTERVPSGTVSNSAAPPSPPCSTRLTVQNTSTPSLSGKALRTEWPLSGSSRSRVSWRWRRVHCSAATGAVGAGSPRFASVAGKSAVGPPLCAYSPQRAVRCTVLAALGTRTLTPIEDGKKALRLLAVSGAAASSTGLPKSRASSASSSASSWRWLCGAPLGTRKPVRYQRVGPSGSTSAALGSPGSGPTRLRRSNSVRWSRTAAEVVMGLLDKGRSAAVRAILEPGWGCG